MEGNSTAQTLGYGLRDFLDYIYIYILSWHDTSTFINILISITLIFSFHHLTARTKMTQ